MQDVWDKFYELKLSLLSQQRHETEALWMVQLDQWMDRLAELGKILVSFTQNRILSLRTILNRQCVCKHRQKLSLVLHKVVWYRLDLRLAKQL